MAFVDRLEAALKARGFEPQIDRAEIYAFEDWWKRIEALIARADTVVFVLSPDAVTSEVALKEIAYAASLNKRFAPIVCRRVEDDAVPGALRRLNFVYFDNLERFEFDADHLAAALKTDIAWIRQHTEFGEAARRWATAGRPGPQGLLLRSPILEEAERWIASHPRGAPAPTQETKDFVSESRGAATRRRRRVLASLAAFCVVIIAGLVAWWNQDWLKERIYALKNAHALTTTLEEKLKPKDGFKECSDCPEMIVIPAGSFMMGSAEPPGYPRVQGSPDEYPQHNVTIAMPFAVSKFELTFDEWDACATYGDCSRQVSDNGYGRGRRPAINVNWEDAQKYLAWLFRITGKEYRLLSEAEYEFATRAGTQTAFPWGDGVGKNNANCIGCGSQWDDEMTAPVGSFAPNQFGLYDMVGNVFEWVADCYHPNYRNAPADGTDWEDHCPIGPNRVIRGGSWKNVPVALQSAFREYFSDGSANGQLGFRVARALTPPAKDVSYVNHCDAFNNVGNYKAALADCNQAVKLNPKNFLAYEKRCYAYIGQGDYNSAIDDCTQAIALNPRDENAFVARCFSERKLQNYAPAIADCTEAVNLDPQFDSGYRQRALTYDAVKDYAHAIADLTKVIALDPENSSAFNSRCWDQAVIDQLEAALADCNQSLHLWALDANAHDSRGFTYLKLGQFDNAIADYSAALTFGPKSATSLYGRGVAELKKGDAVNGNADITAAEAMQADIADKMAALGVRM